MPLRPSPPPEPPRRPAPLNVHRHWRQHTAPRPPMSVSLAGGATFVMQTHPAGWGEAAAHRRRRGRLRSNMCHRHGRRRRRRRHNRRCSTICCCNAVASGACPSCMLLEGRVQGRRGGGGEGSLRFELPAVTFRILFPAQHTAAVGTHRRRQQTRGQWGGGWVRNSEVTAAPRPPSPAVSSGGGSRVAGGCCRRRPSWSSLPPLPMQPPRRPPPRPSSARALARLSATQRRRLPVEGGWSGKNGVGGGESERQTVNP